MIIPVETALLELEAFEPRGDDLAAKSRELACGLLRGSPQPFSRAQFTPGHITCTALVLHPAKAAVLLMFHHRLNRWLLPGGHVEPEDATLRAAAAREAEEETRVLLAGPASQGVAGIDVHSIPAKGSEPYHLHHDILWAFRAASDVIETTDEAPRVCWAEEHEWQRYGLAENIRRGTRRVFEA